MTETQAIATATANLLTAILCGLTAVWTRVAGEVVWLTVLLVVLAVAGLVTAGLILRGPGGSKWTNNEETDDAE